MDHMNISGSSSEINGRLPYLRQITGYMGRQMTKERQVDQFFLDHSYSKPWNSHPFASRTKPARLLFFTYPGRSQSSAEPTGTEIVDVEGSCQHSCPPPYDIIKARSQMSEWESHLINISVEEGQEDWEEHINRSGWTMPQNRIFAKVSKILHADSLAKLTHAGSINEPVMRRIYVDKGAKRLRQVFASFHWDYTLLQWLHLLLLENLSVSYLAAYLDMLQTLKAKVPALVSKIIAVTPSRRAAVTGPETSALWNRRPWDPILPSLAYNKLKKLPGSPLILMVPFAPSQGICNQTKRMRFWLSQLANMGKVIPVTMYAPGGGRSAIVTQCMQHIIGATQTKINELKENFPNRPVILIGWGVGSVIACYVALQERVAAVVCLGFQMNGMKGARGDVDDPILETRVPTLFVIGQNSPICKIDDIEEFREKMKTETNLVIVGGADEWLRINHYKKKEEGITQTAVDRCLLDEISNFLGATLSSLPFQSPDSYGHIYYGNHQPIVRENKRRKRKLDTILEFDDEGGVEAPASKWKAASMHKQSYSGIISSVEGSKLLTPPDIPSLKGADQTLDSAVKSGVKTNPATGKRSYVRKARVHLPVLPESTSSDSSSTSVVSSTKSSCPEKEGDEAVVNAPLSSISPGLISTPPKNNSNSITFNIGFLSSVGQVRRNQSGQSTPKLNTATVVKKSPEVKVTTPSEFNPPTSTTSVLHLYKALSGSTGKSTPVSIYSVPARSAFSIPRAGVKPTIGISSLMSYATTGPKTSAPSSSLLTHTNSDQTQKQQQEQVANQKSYTLEPDNEQVQAIQKLQFHDFPLTTATLSKTTTGLSITQAKILSNCNLDFKKLHTFTTASGLPTTNVVIATAGKLSRNTTPSASDVKSSSSQIISTSSPITSYTLSTVKPAAAIDKVAEGIRVRESSKRSPLSVIVLTPSKMKEIEEVVVTDDTHLLEHEQPAISKEPEPKALIAQDSEPTQKPRIQVTADSANVVGEQDTVVHKLEVTTSVKESSVETAAVVMSSDSDKVPSEQTVSTAEDASVNSNESSPELVSPNQAISRGKFKAPAFPTIAATRTRRIRTPKYMYYDL